MNRTEANDLKNALEAVLESTERISVLLDLAQGVEHDELERRYTNASESLDALCTHGFVSRHKGNYELSVLGERFAGAIDALRDDASQQQMLEPLFDARTDWQSVIPPLEVFETPVVDIDYPYSNECERTYVQFISNVDRLQEVNPLPQYHELLLDALAGHNDGFIKNVSTSNIDVALPKQAPTFAEIDRLRKNHQGASHIRYHEVEVDYPTVLTSTEEGAALWLHRRFGADRSVLVTDAGTDFDEWVREEIDSLLANQSE